MTETFEPLERVGATVRVMQATGGVDGPRRDGRRGQATAPQLPERVSLFLSLLQTHFASAKDARDWDEHDERDYGRLIVPLTGPQTREVFARLRQGQTFRPSVAEVRNAVEEVAGLPELLPAYAVAAMRPASRVIAETLPALAAGAERPALPMPEGATCQPLPTLPTARDRARETLAALRGRMSGRDRQEALRLRAAREEEARRKGVAL